MALKEGITIPLTSIKTVGDSAYKAITEERIKPFKSFEEFVKRVPKAKVKKNVVINLIKAGAFDWYNKNRSSLLVDYYTLRNENADNVFFYCDEVQLMYEKQVYGYYITKHPLDGYDNKHIADFEDGKAININGIISKSTTRKDRNGNLMCFVDLDNKSCSFRGVAFARTYKKFGTNMREGMRVNIVGKKDGSSVIIDNISKI
jgi:DNA polymerase-3 subunit alpha